MFKLLGVLVLAYAGWAAWRGELQARSGFRWALIRRTESPGYFWAVLACYVLLGIALSTVF
ncbi:hypothetical protein QMK61_03840 [Fulvimonas sp. R45]|uniref:hypothetical protein n=1 Tax=Fulvimonas sp. R45 TaxID=3045937 RepID=UPI00265D9615|nr:hypothetical protein [Fulvimonas sp. R45]MDO1527956.1 hypothetical protein [Fulvimonas sp. R45]